MCIRDRIYANWRLKCGENRRSTLTVVGETGPKSAQYYTVSVKTNCATVSISRTGQCHPKAVIYKMFLTKANGQRFLYYAGLSQLYMYTRQTDQATHFYLSIMHTDLFIHTLLPPGHLQNSGHQWCHVGRQLMVSPLYFS